MINADRNIILFNLRLDKTDRREKLIPTRIKGVSFYDTRSSSGTDSRQENLDFKIRIPITAQVEEGRVYIDERLYAELTDEEALKYWTLQKGCYVIEDQGDSFRNEPITTDSLKEARPDIITVMEYADNTRRGSDMVKHWRIGGR